MPYIVSYRAKRTRKTTIDAVNGDIYEARMKACSRAKKSSDGTAWVYAVSPKGIEYGFIPHEMVEAFGNVFFSYEAKTGAKRRVGFTGRLDRIE